MGTDHIFLPQYHQLHACQGSTPFTETGESGSLMVVAVTVYGAKGNRSSWQASTGGNTAGSFRESLVNLTDRRQKWLCALRGDKEKELGRTAGCNRAICLLRPCVRTKSQKMHYLQKSIFHIRNILRRFSQADLPYISVPPGGWEESESP